MEGGDGGGVGVVAGVRSLVRELKIWHAMRPRRENERQFAELNKMKMQQVNLNFFNCIENQYLN